MAFIDARISEEPLDVAAALDSVTDPKAGGIGLFVGTVRAGSSDSANASKEVTGLEYDAHPELAPAKIEDILTAAAEKWDLIAAVAHHRTGSCAVGEITVVVACSAPHRAEALEATRYVIDALKSEVPIWKKELYTDGSAWLSDQA